MKTSICLLNKISKISLLGLPHGLHSGKSEKPKNTSISKMFIFKPRVLCHCLVSASHLEGDLWRAWKLGLCAKLFHFLPCFESVGETSGVHRLLCTRMNFPCNRGGSLMLKFYKSHQCLGPQQIQVSPNPSWKVLAQAATTHAFISGGPSSRATAIPQGPLTCVSLQQ